MNPPNRSYGALAANNGQTIPPPEPDLTPAEMIRRAKELAPWLREQAPAIEDERRISEEVNGRIMASGIYRLLQPRRFGGYEFDLRTFAEVVIEITRGDGSAGWITSFNTAHTWWASQLPEAGQIEVFADGGDMRSPAAIAPQGVAIRTDGGYIADGRWDYCSGCEVSNWLCVIAVVPGEKPDGPPADVVLAFLRRADYQIHDNWHVLGLRATGSKQAIIPRVFVPAHRALSFLELSNNFRAPGHGVHDNPLFRLPFYPIAAIEFGSVVVGLANAAVDAFTEHTGGRRLRFPPFTPARELHRVQTALGTALGRLDAARTCLFEIVARQEARAERVNNGPSFTDTEIRRDLVLFGELMRLCHECVDLLFVAAGTAATRSGSRMERVFRDHSMVRTHYFADIMRRIENFGAISLGLPPYSDP
jgi:3-hydroxy-9,10-secoandrosta-1,3,5(10)-triene-9,17-dione monooxygenase